MIKTLQNYHSILEAQRDLFETYTEHVELDGQRDAEVEILNKSGCIIIEVNLSDYVLLNTYLLHNIMNMEKKISLPI